MTPALAGDNAVPFRVPARFLAVGALALAAFWTTLAVAPQWSLAHVQRPAVLALVHVFTLLFASSVLIGALHQLVPVLLVGRLHAPAWGGPTWLATTAGGAAVVTGFALGVRPAWLATGGLLALTGATLLLANLAATAWTVRRVDLPAAAVLASAAALWTTFAFGTLIALSRQLPALAPAFATVTPLHVTLGLVATFALAIAGAGHKLLAMFVLAHGVSPRWLRAALSAAFAAVAAAAAVAWLPAGLAVPARALVVASVAATALALALDVRAILTRRLRKRPDVYVATYLAGAGAFVPAAALLVLGRPEEAVMLALLGAVAPAIAGMQVKIASFLTWNHRYAGRVGREPGGTPMLADMTVPALGRVTGVGLPFAATATVVARLMEGGATAAPGPWTLALARIGALAGALAAWCLAVHLAWIVFGRHRPSATDPARGGSAATDAQRAAPSTEPTPPESPTSPATTWASERIER